MHYNFWYTFITLKLRNGIMELKLNKKRTSMIGFAFFGILLLWQVYDSWCPPFLTDILSRSFPGSSDMDVQWLVGIIMALDNLAALILLPIFGNLSDRTDTKIGKRMPYILIGTFVSAVAFPLIPLFFHYGKVVGMVITMTVVLIFMMMYRNPAVSLMPDLTPKPLRAKANGIINIVGYFGGAFAAVLGIFFVVSNYLKTEPSSRNLWTIELPFIIASLIMLVSALVLFFTVKEKKIAAEIKDQMEEGERLAAIETPIDDNKPMSKANRNMLFAILGAEFLWFMADNAISTYTSNYVIYHLNSVSYNGTFLTIAGGFFSVVGFAIAGMIADKIGRKWTISSGLFITVAAYLLMTSIHPTGSAVIKDGISYYQFPTMLYVVWAVKGFGMALVHNCSFPMVVELCSSNKIGKFTGFYYTSSMTAQTITPVLFGFILNRTQAWKTLPAYALILTLLSSIAFTLLVKNIKLEGKGEKS